MGTTINTMDGIREERIIEGMKAPDFRLPDQDGIFHTLREYYGQWILLFFYPKDESPACIKEACAIRDAEPYLANLGIITLGISNDSTESHKRFAAKYRLLFPLLADIHKHVVRMYDVFWEKDEAMGREEEAIIRTSFLISPCGTVEKVYRTVRPEIHAWEVIQDVEKIKEADRIEAIA